MPEGAIVVDESITAGRSVFAFTEAAAPHDWLYLTGGAIGDGLPMSVGAAVAAPGRRVITLQADGSAMYTVQGAVDHGAGAAGRDHRAVRQP